MKIEENSVKINWKDKANHLKINWEARFKNRDFWFSLIPAVLLLIQVVAALFGYELDLSELGKRLLAVVDAIFVILAILGVVNDPTTAGLGDSKRALTYSEPYKSDQ